METFLGVALGIGLAAACGFRVFVPFLIVGVAARADLVPLAAGFEWMESTSALVVLGAATLVEILAFALPWIDNLIDTIATPVAVLAGAIAMAAVIVDVPPVARWSLALIAGGGVAGTIQGTSVLARGLSTISTGGLGNFVISGVELVGSIGMSLLAVLLPGIALLVTVGIVVVITRGRARRRERPV